MSDLTKIIEEYPIFMTARELIEMFAKMRRQQSRGDPPKPRGGRWRNEQNEHP
ncbi:MAG: hypothetical protein R3Y68_06335 [Rikenellaceae bacterium]